MKIGLIGTGRTGLRHGTGLLEQIYAQDLEGWLDLDHSGLSAFSRPSTA